MRSRSGVFSSIERAAAYKKRIRACIALSGPFEWDRIWDGLPELTRETFRVRSHADNETEARENAKRLTMKEAAPRITCPIFVVTGRQDRLVPASHAGHNANNRPYRYRSRTADWLAGQFGLPRL
jgi:pimeloyl-ACP methyl ester carboxylesterase